MADPSVSRPRLMELDALRGIGALAVMLFHYTTRFHEMFPRAPHVPFGFPGGNYRVLLFFAISGFAIFFTIDRLTSGAAFLVNRASRLCPAYWVAMMLTLGTEYLGHVTRLQVSPLAILANISMLEGFAFIPGVDGAYWTLTVEIGFYISMFALWRVGAIRRLEPALLVWLAAKWLMAFWPGMPERIVMVMILRYIPFFAIGMLTYRVWAGQRSWTRQAPFIAAVLVTVAALETADIAAAAIILFALFAAMAAGALRFLAVRPLLWLGGISYSLYLVHQNIGFVIMLDLGAMGVDPLVAAAIAIIVVILLGYGLNRLVERPAHRAIDRWWKARDAAALRTAPT